MAESERGEFDDGRYLYCAVRLGPDRPEFTARGVDDEPVRVVGVDGVGVVVHECQSLYDTADADVVRTWVLQHQQVVDGAGETFGTPLPFQFDTILTGTDDRVREWVDEERETFSRHLDALAGHWEYRIEVRREESRLVEELETTDERLRQLGTETDDDSGTAFLRRKQYEKRLTELKREHRAERSAALAERLSREAREVSELGDPTTLAEEEHEEDGMETESRFTVLVAAEREDAIGELLDEVAAESGVEVRFTGPWPPYSFTPTIGGADATE